MTTGEVKLTTDKNPSSHDDEVRLHVPARCERRLQGHDIKAGNYIGAVFQQGKTIDFMPAPIAAGEDKTLDFDMTRKEYHRQDEPGGQGGAGRVQEEERRGIGGECQDREPE